jgi:superfamily II DNA/RNA helicase
MKEVNMNKSFTNMNLDNEVLKVLDQMNITIPTSIQSSTFEHILDKKDIIAQSPTGSGKTLAYLLPILNLVDPNLKENQVIILAPTHELCSQVNTVFKNLVKDMNPSIKPVLIIGDVNINRQIDNLKEKPQVIIGTPGRVSELITMKKIKAHLVKTIILDEADRLISDQLGNYTKAVIKSTLKQRQLVAFSATISDELIKELENFKENFERVNINDNKMNPNIRHHYIFSNQRDKFETLKKLVMSLKNEKCLVFLNRNENIQLVEFKLAHHDIKVASIFGASDKISRKKAIDGFKNGDIKVLITSDLGARGLDISNLNHIVNFDIPKDSMDYLHRTGRTARHDKKGSCYSIVDAKDLSRLKEISKTLNFDLEEKELKFGKIMKVEKE